jgi:hypothetical protein
MLFDRLSRDMRATTTTSFSSWESCSSGGSKKPKNITTVFSRTTFFRTIVGQFSERYSKKPMTPDNADLSRPVSLADVARRSTTLGEFGRNLQEWLHTLRGLTTRARVAAAIRDEPEFLAGRFAEGDAADAWLAAYAELIALRIGVVAPQWAFGSARIRREPWFAETSSDPAIRRISLLRSPLPFKRRNIYAANIDLPLRVRPGRPSLDADHKRKTNAERQRRFRANRAVELEQLRRAVTAK